MLFPNLTTCCNELAKQPPTMWPTCHRNRHPSCHRSKLKKCLRNNPTNKRHHPRCLKNQRLTMMWKLLPRKRAILPRCLKSNPWSKKLHHKCLK